MFKELGVVVAASLALHGCAAPDANVSLIDMCPHGQRNYTLDDGGVLDIGDQVRVEREGDILEKQKTIVFLGEGINLQTGTYERENVIRVVTETVGSGSSYIWDEVVRDAKSGVWFVATVRLVSNGVDVVDVSVDCVGKRF